MSEFVRICGRTDLPSPGEAREVFAGGKSLCVANVDGRVTVLDNVCPHREGPLGQGTVEDGKIVCPWHAWAFDLKTGVSTHSVDARVGVHKLRIDGEDVFAEI
jgi:nitrite reductase (NADH) small subunit